MKLQIAACLGALILPQITTASTLSLTYEGSAAGYRATTIDQVDVDIAGNSNRVAAGGFAMRDATPGGLDAFIAWCLDLGALLGTSGTHGYVSTDTPFGNGGKTLLDAGIARISSVFNANFGEDVLASANSSAGFQLALWEAVYDDDMDITTGTFQASSSMAVEGLAQDYLAAADSYEGPALWDLSFLESTAADRRQNLVTARVSNANLAPVPVPAAGLLLLAALGGLAAVKRRAR
jgi:hypothetical protein